MSKNRSKKFKSPTEEIWAMIKENQKSIKALSARQDKTDQQIKETDQQIKETSRELKESQKWLNKQLGNLGNSWGCLGENLVRGNLAKRLKERGIEVQDIITNIKNQFSEFDLVAINGKELVVVEVKSTLGTDDVQDFKEALKNFKRWWPKMAKNKTIYGAMAYVSRVKKKALTQAEKEGFFVISATGDVIIENKKAFRPSPILN